MPASEERRELAKLERRGAGVDAVHEKNREGAGLWLLRPELGHEDFVTAPRPRAPYAADAVDRQGPGA